ncbi:uncharacterized protein LOC126278157 [Schistocerca gregaria]|uniref:uncharacterized protein LOC126278157 n=1 Tax=Schistocerca gregaria TaxID=7010 RepID=UPI00211F288A|nr:uncharacterized protein LOC126278157 [Schistocerca gregaria]
MPSQKFHMKIWLVAPLVVSVIIGLVQTEHARESRATDREAMLDVNPPAVIDDVSPTVESLISGSTGYKKFLHGGDRVWQSASNIKGGKQQSRVSANVGDLVDGLSTAVSGVVTTVTDNIGLQLRGSGLMKSNRNSNHGKRNSRVNVIAGDLGDGLPKAVGDLVTSATDSIDLQVRGTGLMKSPLNSNYVKRETRVNANLEDLVNGLSTAVGTVITTVTDNRDLQLRGSGLMKSDQNTNRGKRETRVNANVADIVDGLATAVVSVVTTATDTINLQFRGSGSMTSTRNSSHG